ncbi:VOC family protein [Clostridium hydrogenum]|uniref:VOC family protein n=1 Tax=Clostridium hydrogenum TaxID=2855764 RepID=UPI001F23BCEA|nr:VOC family protein [Clostridium hydrogenum]
MEKLKKPVFTLAHVGINTENESKAKEVAALLCSIFDFDNKETEISVFAGNGVEVMKYKGFGTLGHIGFGTDNIEEAIKYLEAKGIKFNYESAKYNEDKKMKLIYLEQEIGGFAIHIVAN